MTAADTTFTVTAEDVEHTARTVTIAQWGVAGVVMVGSAASAGIGFTALHEHWGIGVITGLGVDLALASGLVIGRRLRQVGVTTVWGTVLLWLTGVMTLALNSGAAAVAGRWVLAVAHAFLPVLLVVLTEAGSEAQLKLHKLRRETAAAEKAERDTLRAASQVTSDLVAEAARMRHERDTAQTEAARLTQAREREQAEFSHRIQRLEADLREQTTAAETATEQMAAAQTEMAQLTKRQTATPAVKPARTPADRETRRQWVRDERAAGRKPSGVDVDKRFGPPRNGAAVVKEVLAEEKKRLHVVGGKR